MIKAAFQRRLLFHVNGGREQWFKRDLMSKELFHLRTDGCCEEVFDFDETPEAVECREVVE